MKAEHYAVLKSSLAEALDHARGERRLKTTLVRRRKRIRIIKQAMIEKHLKLVDLVDSPRD